MCTSLLLKDLSGSVYAGRTLELPVELPYLVALLPKGSKFSSKAGNHPELNYESLHEIFGIVVPNGHVEDLKFVEGVNDAGLNFSILAFADTHGPDDTFPADAPVLAAIDLGMWMLARFSSVAEIKAALENQPVLVEPVAALGNTLPHFHYTVHDKTGASLIVEFFGGAMNIFDNPIGVMTNGPHFDWHLTNLNNYTHLSNLDHSNATLLGRELVQPDSGIATVTLPGSDTAVDRFVRAVYYANFTDKADGQEATIRQLSHIMNKFDRPKGATIYPNAQSSALTKSANILNGQDGNQPEFITEYTSWTTMIDLEHGAFFVRSYNSLNYVRFDMDKLFGKTDSIKVIPLEAFDSGAPNAEDVLLSH